MMKRGRRRFQRPPGERPYRRLFVIAAEGAKTEPQYFALFNDQQSVIKVTCLKGSHRSSAPRLHASPSPYSAALRLCASPPHPETGGLAQRRRAAVAFSSWRWEWVGARL
jgi:hypothetical protein